MPGLRMAPACALQARPLRGRAEGGRVLGPVRGPDGKIASRGWGYKRKGYEPQVSRGYEKGCGGLVVWPFLGVQGGVGQVWVVISGLCPH